MTDNKTSRQAKHEYLDAAGSVVDDQEKATGIRYTDLKSKSVFSYQIPDATPGTIGTMLAVFGAKTLATNTASAARNGENQVDEMAAIRERFDVDLAPGRWAIPAERTGGPRIDVEAAITAIEEVLRQSGADTSRVRSRAETEEGYLRNALKNAKVAAAYAVLKGKDVPTENDLA